MATLVGELPGCTKAVEMECEDEGRQGHPAGSLVGAASRISKSVLGVDRFTGVGKEYIASDG